MEHSRVREILEQKKENAQGTSEYNRLLNRIAEFDYHASRNDAASIMKLQEMVNQVIREEGAAEVIASPPAVEVFETDGLLEQISELQLFEAIEPEPVDGERIHEYKERRKEHNLIIYMLAQDLLGAQKVHYDGIIKTKDVEYLTLAGQLQSKNSVISALEEDVTDVRSQLQDETIRANNAEIQAEEADLQADKAQELVKQLEADNEQLTQTIKNLESQIEASKPVETASSIDLQERVANLKAKSKSSDDFMKSFYERNNMEMPAQPEVVGAELFQSQVGSENDSRTETQPGASEGDIEDQGSPVAEDEQETVAETFEERTERRLNTLELKMNRNDIVIQHDLAS